MDVDVDGWLTQLPGPFTQERDPVPLVWEAGWTQSLSGRVQKISSPPGFNPRTAHSVASRYSDWDISGHAFVTSPCVILSYSVTASSRDGWPLYILFLLRGSAFLPSKFSYLVLYLVTSCLRRLVASPSRRNHVFDSRPVRVALGRVSVGVLQGFPVSIILI